MSLARDIADNAAPLPVAIAKQLIWEGVGIDLSEWRKREGRLFAFTTKHPDAREGTMAFMQKRAPKWTGALSKEYPDELA